MLPLVTEKCEATADSQRTFTTMTLQKKPVVVLCCSGGMKGLLGSSSEFTSIGMGRTFNTPTQEYDPHAYRVNAFHPSYAMYYHPTFSVFRDLLVLEFTHAFGVLRGDWVEESWMGTLREEAGQQAKALAQGVQVAGQCLVHGLKRIRELRMLLTDTNFSNLLQGVSAGSQLHYSHIISERLRRICCDISLTFRWLSDRENNRLTTFEETLKEELEEELRELLEDASQCIWNKPEPQRNLRSFTTGVFILHPSDAQPKRYNCLAHTIRQCFRQLFQGLNDSFLTDKVTASAEVASFSRDVEQRRRSFETLSTQLENTLAEWTSRPNSNHVSSSPFMPKVYTSSSKSGFAHCPEDVASPELIKQLEGLSL